MLKYKYFNKSLILYIFNIITKYPSIKRLVLLLVYISLANAGALCRDIFQNSLNGAQFLDNIVNALYGKYGIIILNLKALNYELIYCGANNIICRVFTNNFKEIIMKQVLEMVILFDQIMLNITLGYYRYIGSGSGRQVFDLGNGYVIKVAKNEAGIAQNKSEYKISYNDNSNLFAKVIQVSNDFSLLIMKKADKIDDISLVWKYFNATNKMELFNSKELQNIKLNHNLLLGDFARKNSWGMINGRPVIIDYGFTREVKERYYH